MSKTNRSLQAKYVKSKRQAREIVDLENMKPAYNTPEMPAADTCRMHAKWNDIPPAKKMRQVLRMHF
jgi:hypothetical protein